jgi:hypothetical protein
MTSLWLRGLLVSFGASAMTFVAAPFSLHQSWLLQSAPLAAPFGVALAVLIFVKHDKLPLSALTFLLEF